MAPRWLPRPGLRARITLAFALGALLLSAILAAATFGVTRAQLLTDAEDTATQQVFVNARLVREGLGAFEPGNPAATELLTSLLNPTGSRPILFVDEEWFSLGLDIGEDTLPPSIRQAVLELSPARMRFSLDGNPELAVGIPLPSDDAAYFEVVALDGVEDTLASLGLVLVIASAATTLAGAALGWWMTRRALLPLANVSAAAEAIAGGRLDTRLEASGDADLATLTSSFNDMATALEDRIERDSRFASDVSHELRSPLMTLSASVELLQTRRGELDERGRAAIDLLAADITRFERLVDDLLEISRLDAGQARFDLEPVRASEFVFAAVGQSGGATVPVTVEDDAAAATMHVDKRRLERVIANLLDNADKYAGGATGVRLARTAGSVQITIEDAGPGIDEDQRDKIFDRFSRGGEAGRRSADRGVGVGLGLALVTEHVRLHGGQVWVTDRADGEPGAAFVVELPMASP